MIRSVLSVLLFVFSSSSFSLEKIDINAVNDLLRELERYTLDEKDFENATRHYYEGTVFISYEKVRRKRVKKVESYDDVMPGIRETYESEYPKYSDDNEVVRNIQIHDGGLTATVYYEGSLVSTYENRAFRFFNNGKTVFGLHEGRIVALREELIESSMEKVW